MRVGILGVAHVHTPAYLGILQSMPGVTVAGLSDDDPGRLAAVTKDDRVPLFASHVALIDSGIDAAIVCSETVEHRPIVELLAAAGVPVLCEKPLATTEEDATAIVDVCRRAGVTLMTAFPMRFSPPLIDALSQIEEGGLGSVRAVAATNQGHLPPESWFSDPVAAGGGAVMDHTVHVVDILRWWLGEEVTEVYAVTNRILHAEAVTVETGGLIMVTFANGVFATIDCSWSRPDLYPSWGGLAMQVLTANGELSVDPFAQRLEIISDANGRTELADWGSDTNWLMLEEFLAAVREQRPPAITGVDGLRATEVAFAAYRSAEAGRPVSMPVETGSAP